MRTLWFICALAIIAAGFVLSGTAAQAATTHWVNDNDPNGPPYVPPGTSCSNPGYSTIQAAVTAALPGDTIRVCAGTYAGAVIDKEVHLVGLSGAAINDGPFSHPALFRAAFLFNPDRSGSGSSITGFRIVGAVQPFGSLDDGKLDFGVFSRGADDVTVQANRFTDMLQAITDWNTTGWTIRYNEVEDLWTYCGGGIGILVGGFDGRPVTGNVVSHNFVHGTLQVAPNDCGLPGHGLYDGTGIVLFADFRFGRAGSLSVNDNLLRRNVVSLVSDTPGTVNVNDIELTVATDGGPPPDVMHDNLVDENWALGQPRNGIIVSDGTFDNLLTDNQAQGATEFDCRDDSMGAGTAGTANFWIDNEGATSSPPRICGPDDDDDDDDDDGDDDDFDDDGRDNGDDDDDDNDGSDDDDDEDDDNDGIGDEDDVDDDNDGILDAVDDIEDFTVSQSLQGSLGIATGPGAASPY